MNTVHFELGGRSFNYGGFYRGLRLSCTVSLVLSAFLSWHLGDLARSAPSTIGALGWVFFVTQLAGVVLSCLYFGLPPMVLSPLVAVIVGLAALLALKDQAAQAPLKSFDGTVKVDGDKISFVADKDQKSWAVENPKALKGHEGHHVQVKAHVDADKGSIHIMEVKMLKGGETKKEEMKK